MIAQPAFERSITAFLAPIAQYMNDDGVSEILINGHEQIWIETKGNLHPTDARFPSRQALESALTNISQYCGRPYDQQHPILETQLPDGSRLEAVMAPISRNGTTVSIRRFSKKQLSIQNLIENDSITEQAAMFLARAINKKMNIVISGGTGSGKTSLLCALASFIADDERIVVIEDTHELRIPKPHVVYLETRSADERGKGRITIRQLLKATLRLRPDRIVIGEVRGGEALDLVQAMTSGHAGSLTTVHANSPRDAFGRFESMIMASQQSLPHMAVREQLCSAINLVVQVSRTRTGARQITRIDGVNDIGPNGAPELRPLFTRMPNGALDAVFTNNRRQTS